jgi:hypothetical protein
MGRSRVYCTHPANANWHHNTTAALPIPRKPPQEPARSPGSAYAPPLRGYPTTGPLADREGPSPGWVTEPRGQSLSACKPRAPTYLAGSAQFELVATGVTGPYGGFRLSSPPLAATAIFRVLRPDSAHSVAVRVTVAASKITARVAAAPGPAATG